VKFYQTQNDVLRADSYDIINDFFNINNTFIIFGVRKHNAMHTMQKHNKQNWKKLIKSLSTTRDILLQRTI